MLMSSSKLFFFNAESGEKLPFNTKVTRAEKESRGRRKGLKKRNYCIIRLRNLVKLCYHN